MIDIYMVQAHMEIFNPATSTRYQHSGKHETSRQRMDTEAPITMFMITGDRYNKKKMELARYTAMKYKNMISTFDLHQLLSLTVGVVDFMSFVDYGDGRSLPAEVGVASGKLGMGEVARVYGEIPHIPFNDQRKGYMFDAKDSCDRIHGIDILEERASKLQLSTLCQQLKGELAKCEVLLCRSEDIVRVLGAYNWLQNHPAGSELPNIDIMLVEEFLVLTLKRLQLISGTMEEDIPTFTQFTILLASSKNDLDKDFRCDYHNNVESAWDKSGCARKNAKKYMSAVYGVINRTVWDGRRVERGSPPLLDAPTAQRTSLRATEHTNQRPSSRCESTVSSSSSSSYQSACSQQQEISSSLSSGSGRNSSSPRMSPSSPPRNKSLGSVSWKTKNNPLGLLPPDFFTKPPASHRSSVREEGTSHVTETQASHLPPAGADSKPPPRRPQGYSARAKNGEKPPLHNVENDVTPSLPSAGYTNLKSDESTPRRPAYSYDKKSEKKEKRSQDNIPCAGIAKKEERIPCAGIEKKANLPKPLESYSKNNSTAKNPPVKHRGRRGTSTVPVTNTSRNTDTCINTDTKRNTDTQRDYAKIPSDTVLVPTAPVVPEQPTSDLIFDLKVEDLDGPVAAPHPAFLEAFSADTSQQTVIIDPLMQIMLQPNNSANSASGPPPGFGPVPQHQDVVAGFIAVPSCSSTNRVKLNTSFSSDDTGNSSDSKPVKKRGRK